MKSYANYLLIAFSVSLLYLSACKKHEIPEGAEKPIPSIRMNMDSVILANDGFLGASLAVILDHFPEGTSDSVEWRVENPRIAEVTPKGVVFPKGAGSTYVFAKLPNL